MTIRIKDILLFVLAIVFSVALMFAFIEFPRWFDAILHKNVGFPGFDQGASEEAAYLSDLFIDSLHLRWIGYGSLVLVCTFIVIGFVTRKSKWAWAGALVIFLPVFGQFALSMFFLSGLGILRTGWLPFMESGIPLLDFGMVIYIPLWILMWFFGLFKWYAYDFVSWLFMSAGAFLFVWGVFVWFQNRFGSKGVAKQWIYKISRHPQYLGWIIWSYGFMLFSIMENQMKKSWGVATSFPWLIMTMIIIAICMIEELSMKDKYGEEYDEYRSETPFLFPLPKWIKTVLKAPMRLVTRKDHPENVKQVAGVSLVYTIIFIAISLIWVDFKPNEPLEFTTSENSESVLDSITTVIQETKERRQLSVQFEQLGRMGKQATDQLIKYLSDNDPVKREFAANQLGKLKDTAAVRHLLAAINDGNWRVRNSAVNALGEIGDQRAVAPVMEMMRNVPPEERYRYYKIVGSLGATEALLYLVDGLNDERWYIKNTALNSMVELDVKRAMPYVYEALEDTHYQVRRKAVFLLLNEKPPEAAVHLKKVLDDEDFETRFYAQQVINLIEHEEK